jgi:hypothetical protein
MRGRLDARYVEETGGATFFTGDQTDSILAAGR